MKLIDREPTPEMLFAARFYKEGQHTLACAWRAMYDTAPEVNVQAEIAKRDARIAELEGECAGRRDDLANFARITSERVEQQAAEISRLKGVIAKCKDALIYHTEQTRPILRTNEALAAIKEEGL